MNSQKEIAPIAKSNSEHSAGECREKDPQRGATRKRERESRPVFISLSASRLFRSKGPAVLGRPLSSENPRQIKARQDEINNSRADHEKISNINGRQKRKLSDRLRQEERRLRWLSYTDR